MFPVSKVTKKNFIGDFRTADGKQYVGSLCKTPAGKLVIVGQKNFGNGEVVWGSAAFDSKDVKQIGSFGGVRDYTAR